LVAARPPSVAALIELRANIAAAQIDELLTVSAGYNDVVTATVGLGAATELSPTSTAVTSSHVAFDAPTAHPGQESRSSPIENLARRLRLTKLSQVRTTLVVGVLLAAAAFALSSLVLTPRSRARTPAVGTFGARDRPTPTTPVLVNNLVGRVVIVATNQDDKIVSIGSDATGYSCEGAGGYSDVKPGSVVTVTDGGSRVIAQGQIDQGKPTMVLFESKEVPACALHFEVTGVPNSATYGITVGHDGAFYNRQQLVADHWSPSLTFWR
jgi:hypothetical protein